MSVHPLKPFFLATGLARLYDARSFIIKFFLERAKVVLNDAHLNVFDSKNPVDEKESKDSFPKLNTSSVFFDPNNSSHRRIQVHTEREKRVKRSPSSPVSSFSFLLVIVGESHKHLLRREWMLCGVSKMDGGEKEEGVSSAWERFLVFSRGWGSFLQRQKDVGGKRKGDFSSKRAISEFKTVLLQEWDQVPYRTIIPVNPCPVYYHAV
ncbi:hypothetical protein TNCV_220031 [Trichonephila clavipes]|nr:hypothetical protein TNCV_220031 [Trichonephila clavipes]